MTRLLLDTEALIWWDTDDRRLGKHARAAIQRAGDVYVSAVSAWEIAIKTALGKLRTKRRPADAVADADFRELALTFQHTEALADLPSHHADPFDRLLLAVATVEGLAIVTSDRSSRSTTSRSSMRGDRRGVWRPSALGRTIARIGLSTSRLVPSTATRYRTGSTAFATPPDAAEMLRQFATAYNLRQQTEGA